jgi:hypothetical protein
MPFVFLRLLAQTALVSVMGAYASLVLLLISALVGIENSGIVLVILLLIFGGFGLGIYRFLSRYISYMIKSAHVAVITELSEHGAISTDDGIVSYGVGKVKQRFVSTNVFFVLDKLIAGAVKQIQHGVSSVAGWLSAIPGVKQIASILNLFIGIVLNYVDEAVMSHIFRSNNDNAWKGAADGIVLYFQNWKSILKNAAFIVIFLLAWYIGGSIIIFFGLSGLFKLIIPVEEIALYVAVLLALAIVLIIKAAVIDPLILISIINNYTKVTTGQTPAIDIYEKARQFSKKFRKIEEKSGVTTPAAPAVTPPVPADSSATPDATTPTPTAPPTTPPPADNPATPSGNSKPLIRGGMMPIVNASNPLSMVGGIINTELINRGIDAINDKYAEHQANQQKQATAPPPDQVEPTQKGGQNGQQ